MTSHAKSPASLPLARLASHGNKTVLQDRDATSEVQPALSSTRVTVLRALRDWAHADGVSIAMADLDRVAEIAVGQVRRRT